MPCDRLVGGISKRSHRGSFAGHGAVRLSDPAQNDIWAERFIKTLLAEWAYARPYRSNAERRKHPIFCAVRPRPATDDAMPQGARPSGAPSGR